MDESQLPEATLAEITSLEITPAKLDTNRINLLKVVFRFNYPENNIFGGRVIIH